MTTTKTKRTKLWISLAVALAAIAAALFAAAYLLLPSGYLGIDVNPSIEIQTNRLGKVTGVQAANEDAAQLLYGYRISDDDLDDVVEDLVDLMILKGYITAGGPNDVLITVGSDAVSQDVLNWVNQRIAKYLATRQLSANVMGQQVALDGSLRQSADAAGVSAGRMALIERLLNGGALTRDELAQMTVADLLEYARANNIPLDILEDRLDDMDDRYDGQQDNILDNLEDGLDDLDDTDGRYGDDLDGPDDFYTGRDTRDGPYDDRGAWDALDDPYDDSRNNWDNQDDRYDDDRYGQDDRYDDNNGWDDDQYDRDDDDDDDHDDDRYDQDDRYDDDFDDQDDGDDWDDDDD